MICAELQLTVARLDSWDDIYAGVPEWLPQGTAALTFHLRNPEWTLHHPSALFQSWMRRWVVSIRLRSLYVFQFSSCVTSHCYCFNIWSSITGYSIITCFVRTSVLRHNALYTVAVGKCHIMPTNIEPKSIKTELMYFINDVSSWEVVLGKTATVRWWGWMIIMSSFLAQIPSSTQREQDKPLIAMSYQSICMDFLLTDKSSQPLNQHSHNINVWSSVSYPQRLLLVSASQIKC